VDGLFLVQKLFYGDDVCLGLWNPATREFRSLPPAPFEIESFFSHHNHQYGLGFDLLTLDYKVVWLRGLWDDLGLDVHWPLNIWDNNKMVFKITGTSELVLYDPKTRRVTDLGFQLDRNINDCCFFNYKESLVPIKRGNKTQGDDNAVKKIENYFDMIPMDEASS
uniref:F-box associated domain-containing protein n=1 Tax=Solanum lycopersicum TaxID=4081 RepID=A0A3Q7G379_SOLLC